MFIYILIGLIYGLLVTISNEHSISNGAPEDQRFTALESIILVAIWPVYLIMFIHFLFKGD